MFSCFVWFGKEKKKDNSFNFLKKRIKETERNHSQKGKRKLTFKLLI